MTAQRARRLHAGGPLTLAFSDSEVGPKAGETVWSAPPTFHDVPWGGLAEGFLVVAPLAGGGLRLILSRPSDWTVEPGAVRIEPTPVRPQREEEHPTVGL